MAWRRPLGKSPPGGQAQQGQVKFAPAEPSSYTRTTQLSCRVHPELMQTNCWQKMIESFQTNPPFIQTLLSYCGTSSSPSPGRASACSACPALMLRREKLVLMAGFCLLLLGRLPARSQLGHAPTGKPPRQGPCSHCLGMGWVWALHTSYNKERRRGVFWKGSCSGHL